jgi:hypothetical protein
MEKQKRLGMTACFAAPCTVLNQKKKNPKSRIPLHILVFPGV